MKFYTGDCVGRIKEINAEGEKYDARVIHGEKVDKNEHIIAMTTMDDSRIVLALTAGRIMVFNVLKSVVEKVFAGFIGELLGVFCDGQKITTATKEGRIFSFLYSDYIDIEVPDIINDTRTKRIIIERSIDAFAVHPALHQYIAVGGKDLEIRLFDIDRENANKPIFCAKNQAPDQFGLPAPIHITVIGFLDNSSPELIISGTVHHHLRMHDIKKQRRAIFDADIGGGHSFCSLALSCNLSNVLIGDISGQVFVFNVKEKKVIGHLKGNMGTVMCIQCHPTLPVALTAGLDHYVRIYDLDTRDLIMEMYLKQKITAALWTNDEIGLVRKSIRQKKRDEIQDAELDNIWDNMESIVPGAKKRKQ